MKRAIVAGALSAIVLAQVFLLPAAAFADQWVPVYPPNSTYEFTFSDNSNIQHESWIVAELGADGVNGQESCPAITSSGPCAIGSGGNSGAVFAFLPECTSPTQVDCIASMALGPSASTLVASTPVGMTEGQTTAGDPTLGVPDGSTIGLWTNPLLNDGGTDTYSTQISFNIGFINGTHLFPALNASINPYKLVSNPADYAPYTLNANNEGTPVVEYHWGPGNCAFEQTGECGQNEDFPPGTVASMTVRVPSTIGGWFMGRLSDPSISDSAFNETTSLITVTAGVVTTPTLAIGLTAAQTSSQVMSYIYSQGLPTTGFNDHLETNNPLSFAALDALRISAGNTASGQLTIWNFASAPSGLNGQTTSSCFSEPNRVDGIVSTNALVYQGSTPTFSNNFIQDEVAGMHYNADGSVAQGSYDLNIPNSVADCLYGFSNAPISATVSVTEDSSGDQNVATKTVSDTNGWLHVGAYGFNFSDPTIKVRLTQVEPKVTIVCVKGKIVKRITSRSLKCPIGFKRR